jgi:hypothetical protein
VSPQAAVEVINSMSWPEDWAEVTAEFVPAHPEWDDAVQANVTVPAVIRVRAELPCEWFAHGKPVVHGVTLQSDGERDLHVDTVRSLADNTWRGLADHLVRDHAEPRLRGEISEQIAQAEHVLELYRAAQQEGGQG